MNVSVPRYSIHELAPGHRDWPEYVDVVEGDGQSGWAFDTRDARFRRRYLMARQDGRVVGFLMYLIWQIGPNDRNHPPLAVDGAPLTEAKIIPHFHDLQSDLTDQESRRQPPYSQQFQYCPTSISLQRSCLAIDTNNSIIC